MFTTPEDLERNEIEKIVAEFKRNHRTPTELLRSRLSYHREAAAGLFKQVRESKHRVKKGTDKLYILHKDYEDMYSEAVDCLRK